LINNINVHIILGPMIEHILVSCSSKSFRDTWINHLNSILKSTRFPSFCSSPQQVQKQAYLPNNQQLHQHHNLNVFSVSSSLLSPLTSSLNSNSSVIEKESITISNTHVPSQCPPYTELVAYFQHLYSKGLIHTKSFELMEALESSLDWDNIDLECIRRVKPAFKQDLSPLRSHPGSWDVSCGRIGRLKRFNDRNEQYRIVQSVSVPQKQEPTLEISFCSDDEDSNHDSISSSSTIRDSYSSQSSSPSEYRLTKEPGYPFHKWRWGMSNLCVEKLIFSRTPSSNCFLSPSKGGVGQLSSGSHRIRDKSPGDCGWDKSKSITFGDKKLYWKVKGTFSSVVNRSQSLPSIKVNQFRTKSDGSKSEDGQRNTLTLGGLGVWTCKKKSSRSLDDDSSSESEPSRRGRLVRQNAFDFDDGDVENLPDLNDNLELVSNAYEPIRRDAQEVVEDRSLVSLENGSSVAGAGRHNRPEGAVGHIVGGGSSFDSGLGDLTPSNRTTQTNFYEEISFEISSVLSPQESDSVSVASSSESSSNPQGESYRSNLYAHWLLKFESSSQL